MNPTANKYEVQGRDVARQLGLEIRCAYQGGQCPPWARPSEHKSKSDCAECESTHGDKYRVTIKRTGRTGPGSAIHFDFWASWADCYVLYQEAMNMTPAQRGKAGVNRWLDSVGYSDGATKGARGNLWYRRIKHVPSEYTILACVSSDMSNPTDADSVVEEFGPMLPSQAEVIAAHARKLQAFFTEAERAILSEVQ